jgi:hypothetical protein
LSPWLTSDDLGLTSAVLAVALGENGENVVKSGAFDLKRFYLETRFNFH